MHHVIEVCVADACIFWAYVFRTCVLYFLHSYPLYVLAVFMAVFVCILCFMHSYPLYVLAVFMAVFVDIYSVSCIAITSQQNTPSIPPLMQTGADSTLSLPSLHSSRSAASKCGVDVSCPEKMAISL